MVDDEIMCHAFPAEARGAIWRIFGNGESPLSQAPTYDLIEPIARKRVPTPDQDQAISEICSWFESQGNEPRLKEDMRKPVGALILNSIKDALSSSNGVGNGETAFWAVGSIEADFATQVIRSTWSSGEIDLFVSCMLKALGALCKRDAILDASRIWGFDVDNAKVAMKDVPRQRMLETFRDQDDNFWYMYSGVSNVVKLLVKLSPDKFHELVARAESSGTSGICGAIARSDAIRNLRRIMSRCDASVTIRAMPWLQLAILHTLNNVNSIDSELLRSFDPGRQPADEVEDAATWWTSCRWSIDSLVLEAIPCA